MILGLDLFRPRFTDTTSYLSMRIGTNMRGELIFNSILFCLSLFLYYVAGTFKKFASYAKLGPEFWPRGILILMILLTGVLLIKNITSLLKPRTVPATEEPSQERGRYRFLLVVALSFAYAFGMGLFGFILSTFVFQLVFLYLLKIKRFRSIVLVSLLNTGMLYILFILVLNMLLPTGVGIFRTFSLYFY
jgi:putative tricarboxylic transport membrane protein